MIGADGDLRRDLQVMTGERAAGRLAGSDGARLVSSYLAEQLERAGGRPMNGDWFQPVAVGQNTLQRRPRVAVDGVPLSHRLDFSERPDLGGAGSGSGRLVVAEDGDEHACGAVLLIDGPGVDVRRLATEALESGVAAILVRDSRLRWPRKVVHGGGAGVPVFSLSAPAFRRLKNARGSRVEFDAVHRDETVECRNVVGAFGSTGADRAILLTAHFDHVGDDPDGPRFPGAFDNASGVSVILGVARAIGRGSRGAILIALLTGEESGLWGARALLAAGTPLPLAAVINVDGIGSEPLRAVRLGTPPAAIASTARQILGARDIETRPVSGRDDSLVFHARGLPTIGLGQEPLIRPQSFLHTPGDRNVSATAIRDAIDLTTTLALALVEQKGAES